jgi:two-component system, LuxR family, sensor kinase FixL
MQKGGDPTRHNVITMRPARIHSLPLPVVGGLYIGLHVLLDWASFIHPFGTFGITPWNPSTGLIFAFVLLFGLRALWYVLIALLLANQIVRGAPVPAWLALSESVIVCAGYTVTLLALLRPGLRFKASLHSTRDLLLLLAAATIGSAVVSLVYLGMLFETGLLPREEIVAAGLRYWVGDMIGIAIAAPFGLLVLTRERLFVPGWEVVLQVSAIACVLWTVVTFSEHHQLHLLYLLFLPVTWIAVRSGLEGVSTSLVLIQVGLFVVVQLRAPTIDITDFQFRMLVLAVTGLIAGARTGRRLPIFPASAAWASWRPRSRTRSTNLYPRPEPIQVSSPSPCKGRRSRMETCCCYLVRRPRRSSVPRRSSGGCARLSDSAVVKWRQDQLHRLLTMRWS